MGYTGCFGSAVLQGARPDPAVCATGQTPEKRQLLITSAVGLCFASDKTKLFLLFALFRKIQNFEGSDEMTKPSLEIKCSEERV